MLRLVVNPGTPQAWPIQLKPGPNSIGRGFANDFQINDPSVSTAHCEIFVTPEAVRFKDLGSTNGSFLNQAPVQESLLQAGHCLRLGSVEIHCESAETPGSVINLLDLARMELPAVGSAEPPTPIAPAAAAEAPAPAAPAAVAAPAAATHTAAVESDVPVFCKNHYQNAARFYCAKCKRYLCDLCVNTRGMAAGGLTSCKICARPCSPVSLSSHVPKAINFYRSVWPSFKYPVQGDGVITLVLGVFFFGFLDAAYYIALNAGKFGLLGMRGMMMRAVVICFVLGTGYLFSYLKKIVYATASGEHRLPDWPELSEWQADILAPMFHFLIISLISFGPALTVRIWYDGDHMGAVWGLMLLGCIYFPMGMLGVAMFDTLSALNPLFVIGSMFKVPGEYAVAALVFTAILGFRLLIENVFRMFIHVPLLPVLLSDLLAIYLLIVETRILGLLYLSRKDTLGWFRKRRFPQGVGS